MADGKKAAEKQIRPHSQFRQLFQNPPDPIYIGRLSFFQRKFGPGEIDPASLKVTQQSIIIRDYEPLSGHDGYCHKWDVRLSTALCNGSWDPYLVHFSMQSSWKETHHPLTSYTWRILDVIENNRSKYTCSDLIQFEKIGCIGQRLSLRIGAGDAYASKKCGCSCCSPSIRLQLQHIVATQQSVTSLLNSQCYLYRQLFAPNFDF